MGCDAVVSVDAELASVRPLRERKIPRNRNKMRKARTPFASMTWFKF